MISVNDIVTYSTTGACRIIGTVNREFCKDVKKYYVLESLCQKDSTVFVPVDNEKLVSKMKKLLSRDEVLSLIEEVKSTDDSWIAANMQRREAYSAIIAGGERKDILNIIKTLYHHRAAQTAANKKLHISDERTLKIAEKMLFGEFSIVLDEPINKIERMIEKAFSE